MPSTYAGCPFARHQEAKITLLSPQLLAEKQKALGRGRQQKAAGKAHGEAGRHLQSEPRGLQGPQAPSSVGSSMPKVLGDNVRVFCPLGF